MEKKKMETLSTVQVGNNPGKVMSLKITNKAS